MLMAEFQQPVQIPESFLLIFARILVINKQPVIKGHPDQVHARFFQEHKIRIRHEIHHKGFKKSCGIFLSQYLGKGIPYLLIRSRHAHHEMLHVQPASHSQAGEKDRLVPENKFFSFYSHKIHRYKVPLYVILSSLHFSCGAPPAPHGLTAQGPQDVHLLQKQG